MKKITKIVFIISVLLIVFIFAACDSLIAPQKGRNNPLDPKNPVPAATNFNLNLNDSDPSNRSVSITWGDGTSDVEKILLEGYIIIRKKLEVPESIYDGNPVALKTASESKEFIEENIDLADSGYPVGNKVYYSIFSYGSKWDDMNESEFLKLEDGMLKNAGNYNFTGPVSASVIVVDFLDLPVSDDKYMSEVPSVWVDNEFLNVVTDNNVSRTIVGIKFNLTDTPDANFEKVELLLTKNGNSTDNSDVGMDVSCWTGDWTEATDWTTLLANGSSSIGNVQVPYEAQAVVSVDVADIFLDWLDNSIPNYGFRLRSLDSPAVEVAMPFSASEDGQNGPKLRVWYYND